MARNIDQNDGSTTSGSSRPGHVVWIPRGSTWLTREKSRPFAVVAPCGPEVQGTLVYGSTQETERRSGAAAIAVAPVREGINRNGLHVRTCFYPGTLLLLEQEDLPSPAGFLGRPLADLRNALRNALGIGRGSCLSPGAPAGSRRGRIVELKSQIAHALRARFAVLLTEPRYSRATNYHLILPVYPGAAGDTHELDLQISGRDWLAVFPGAMRTALLPVPVTQSVWYAHDVARETEFVVDEDTLAQIDRRLCAYFSLPLAVGG